MLRVNSSENRLSEKQVQHVEKILAPCAVVVLSTLMGDKSAVLVFVKLLRTSFQHTVIGFLMAGIHLIVIPAPVVPENRRFLLNGGAELCQLFLIQRNGQLLSVESTPYRAGREAPNKGKAIMTMAHNGVKAGDGALGRSRIGEMLSCVPIAFLVVAFRVGAVVLCR